MTHFLKLRILRDLADGPTIGYDFQKKYQSLDPSLGNASCYNSLKSLCRDGLAFKQKIGQHNQYFISSKGIEILEYFQFNRDTK